MVFYLGKTLAVQPSGVLLPDTVHNGVRQAAIGFSVTELIN
jgi:hypothetical protein